MKEKNITFFDLVSIVDEAKEQTSDVIIAKALIENRYQLDDLSLDKLSERYYLSQASISRFIKKMCFKNYSQFKRELALSLYGMQDLHPTIKQLSTQQIISSTYEDISQTLDFFKNIDEKSLDKLVRYINQYQNIYFFGSKLSVSIVHLLQQYLIMQHKNVYTLYELSYQKKTLKQLKENDLVICISLEGRWLNHIEKEFKNASCTKLLWTPKNSQYVKENYLDIFYLGTNAQNNLGYHYLMYFVLLVYKLLLSHSNNE